MPTYEQLLQQGATPLGETESFENLQNAGAQSYADPVKTKAMPKGIVGNLALGAGKGILSTTTSLGQLALKGYGAIPFLPGKQLVKDSIQTGEDFKNNALKTDNTAQAIGKTAEQIAEMFIPVGAAGATAKVLSKVPQVAKNAPLVAKAGSSLLKTGIKAAGSAVEFGGKTYLQTGGDVEASKQAAKISAVIPFAAQGIKGLGEGLAKFPISLSSKEAKLVQAYKANVPFWERVLGGGKSQAPITSGKTAFDKGIAGTEGMIGVQAKRGATNLWDNMISPALDKSKVVQNMKSFWKEAQEEIIRLNPELSRQKSLLNALEAFKKDYKGVGTATMKQLQNYKSGWAEFVPEKAYKGEPIAGAFNDVKDTIAGIARTKIYDALGPEAKRAYFDYGNLINLQELGQKAMTGGKLKGGFGSFWSAVKDIGLTPITTIGGKIVYKVGKGIEFVGERGAKTIKDLFSNK